MPAFINLQQYYVEEFLVDRIGELPRVDLRWKNRVTRVESRADGVQLEVETPDGRYALSCDYLLAADGANSLVRESVGAVARGQEFHDQFLICDISMHADFPTERWFWFDPPFHPGHSVLLHRQPDNVWRVDFQIGADADAAQALRIENIRPRIDAMLGAGTDVGSGMGERVHVPLPETRSTGARPRAVHRRFGASGVAVRCARRQRRRAGGGESGVEARARDPRRSAGCAAVDVSTPNGSPRRPRTCCTRRARRTSSRRRVRSAACSATRCCGSRSAIRLHARWSTAGDCRRRVATTIRR